MATPRSTLLALLIVIAFSGCGGDDVHRQEMPDGAVAVVDGHPVSRETLERFAVLQLRSEPDGEALALAEPPDFSACASALAGALDGAPQREADRTPLTQRCKERYEGARKEAMSFLLQGETTERQAAERGVTLTEQELRRAAARVRKASFADEAEFESYLRKSGATEEDYLFGLRAELLRKRLREDLHRASARPATEGRLTDYFTRHRDEFALPARRRVRILVARTRRSADVARTALRRGRSWSAVVAEHAVEGLSRRLGGKPLGVPEGTQEPAADEAIFDAALRRVSGPVRIGPGWIVFEVVAELPARDSTLEEARDDVERALAAEASARTERAMAALDRAWRGKTQCLPELAIAQCANGPEPRGAAVGSASGAAS
jgi:parvulin-like peptidyl-prolyl isomerase